MAGKATKYGILIIAIVLLVGVACAGAASATDITSQTEFETYFGDGETADAGTYYFKGNWELSPTNLGGSVSLDLGGDVILDFSGFTGTFKGDKDGDSGKRGGLFGYVDLSGEDVQKSLTVQNLNMVGTTVEADSNSIGGLIGYFRGYSSAKSTLTFKNCCLTNCVISGSGECVGGLAGCVEEANVNVEDCIVQYCDITSTDTTEGKVGGLIGSNYTGLYTAVANIKNTKVLSCVIYDKKGKLGGLLGYGNGVTIENCNVENSIIFSTYQTVGGLCGNARNGKKISDCTVKNCLIESTYSVYLCYVGGLFGFLENTETTGGFMDCTVEDCTIYGPEYTGQSSAYGLIGGFNSASVKGTQTNDVLNCAVSGSTIFGSSKCDSIGRSSTGSISSATILCYQSAYPSTATPIARTADNYYKLVQWSGVGSPVVKYANIGAYGQAGGHGNGAAPKYAVTYDGNGADSGTVPSDTNQYLPYSGATVLDNTGNLEKKFCAFNGWNVGSPSGTFVEPGETFKVTADTTLYVAWNIVATVNLTLNPRGGNGIIQTHLLLPGQETTIPNPGFTRTGFTQSGWSDDPEDTTVKYQVGETITPTDNMTLYAVWGQGGTTNVTLYNEPTFTFFVPSDVILSNEAGGLVGTNVSIIPGHVKDAGKDIIMRVNTTAEKQYSSQPMFSTFSLAKFGSGDKALYTLYVYADKDAFYDKEVTKQVTGSQHTTGGYTDANNIVIGSRGAEESPAVSALLGFKTDKLPSVAGVYTGQLTFTVGVESPVPV